MDYMVITRFLVADYLIFGADSIVASMPRDLWMHRNEGGNIEISSIENLCKSAPYYFNVVASVSEKKVARISPR